MAKNTEKTFTLRGRFKNGISSGLTKLAKEFGILKTNTKEVEANARKAAERQRLFFSGAQRMVGRLNKELSSTLKLMRAVKALAVGGLFAGVIGFGAGKAIAGSIKAEEQFAQVTTLIDNISKKSAERLKDAIQDAAVEGAQTVEQEFNAAYQAISAGVGPNQLIEFLTTANQMAIAGATDVTSSVELLTSILNAYNMEADEAAQVSDLLFKTVQRGKTTIPELSANISQVVPAAAAMNIELKDVTAAMAVMTVQGVKTNQAATSLRNIIIDLGKEGTKADQAFREASGVGFRQFIEEGGRLAEAIRIIDDHANSAGESVEDLFGKENVAGIATVTGTGFQKMVDLLREMDEAAGTTREQFEKMSSTAGVTLRQLNTQVRVLANEISEGILPGVSETAKQTSDVLGMVTKLIRLRKEAVARGDQGAVEEIDEALRKLSSAGLNVIKNIFIEAGGLLVDTLVDGIARGMAVVTPVIGRALTNAIVGAIPPSVRDKLGIQETPDLRRQRLEGEKVAAQERLKSSLEFQKDPMKARLQLQGLGMPGFRGEAFENLSANPEKHRARIASIQRELSEVNQTIADENARHTNNINTQFSELLTGVQTGFKKRFSSDGLGMGKLLEELSSTRDLVKGASEGQADFVADDKTEKIEKHASAWEMIGKGFSVVADKGKEIAGAAAERLGEGGKSLSTFAEQGRLMQIEAERKTQEQRQLGFIMAEVSGEQFALQKARLNERFDQMRQFVLQQDQITGDERLLLMNQIESKRLENMQEFERQGLMQRKAAQVQILSAVEGTLANMNALFEKAGLEGTAMAKVFLVMQKAVAMAGIWIQTQLASMSALAPPPFGLGPVAGQALAGFIQLQGATAMGLVAATTLGELAGGFAEGGVVPGRPSRKDNTLAAVASGEGILNSMIMGRIGNERFARINRGEALEMSEAREAGLVSDDSSGSGPQVVAVLPAKDSHEYRDFMNSEDALIHTMRSSGKVKTFIKKLLAP